MLPSPPFGPDISIRMPRAVSVVPAAAPMNTLAFADSRFATWS